MEGGESEGQGTGAKVKVTVPWVEGTEDDFRDLREAVGEGRTTAGKFDTGDPNSSTSEEDEEDCEPAEDEKGARLLWAAQFGRQDVLESLLEEDPDLVGFRDGDGYSALHRAAYSGRRAACAGLLSRGADVAARTEDGWTPLHSACRWNRADCAEELLASGAPVNARTCGGQTPLHLAAFCGNSSETLQVLLTCGRRLDYKAVNDQGETAGDIARRNGNCLSYFETLLQHEVNETSDL